MEGDSADRVREGNHVSLDAAGGLALPTRQASVVLIHADEGEHQSPTSAPGNGLRRQDSLEGTRTFYGVGPTSPLSSSTHRASSSRQPNRARSTSNSHSQFSVTSRPNTPFSALPTSPPRSSVPLPIPKGFLSPKKPASAIRLEKKTIRSSTTEHRPSVPSQLDTVTQTSSPDPLSAQVPTRSLGAAVSLGSDSDDGRNGIRPSKWDHSLRHSIPEPSMSSRTHRSERSSNELFRDLHRDGITSEKTNGGQTNGTGAVSDEERGNRPLPKDQKRKYESFENPLTTFFFSGRLMTGGDSPLSMGLVAVVLFGISGVWLGTTGAWTWVHGRDYGLAKGAGVAITIIFAYLFCLVFSSLLASAFRDPGIIPRKLDLDPPLQDIDDEWCEAWPRELTVNGKRVTVKYCETCQSYRPPRSSHCRLCGNCVDGIDHHCSYLHTCVGKRNYFSFLVLLISASISDIYIVVFSALHFSLICHHEHVSFGHALSDSPGAAVSFLLGVLSLPPMLFLLWYHLRLLLYNITTVEQIRASASNNLLFTRHRPDNPFGNPSIWRNVILASVARPQFPSWINANGYERVDRREVNPALTDSKWRSNGFDIN